MQAKKMVPKPQSTCSFAELSKDFLLSSAIMETNFHLLFQATGCSDRRIQEIIGDAPRKVNDLLIEIEKFVSNTMGKAWLECTDRIVTTTRSSILGLNHDDDDNIAVIKINDHEEKFQKFVFEFQLKQMIDPSISSVAKAFFEECNFVPTYKTSTLLSATSTKPRILFERKHNNFILNLCDLDKEVERRNLKKGDKRFDVLSETLDSLIVFGNKIQLKNGFLSAPIDYACY